MPPDRVSQDFDSMPRSAGARERVSSGRTRGPWVACGFRLVAIVLAAIAAMAWSVVSGHLSSSEGRISLAGHTRLVQAVAFSPDGRRLASCGYDFAVRLWDTSLWDGERPADSEVLPHGSVVIAAAFSPDGSLLATAAAGSVTLWSRGPTYRIEVERPGDTYRCLAFSPNGRTLALGGEDSTIRLWEMPEARERAILRGHAGEVRSVAFAPDGRRLVSGDEQGRLVLWDAIEGVESRVLLEDRAAAIRSVAFSPDGGTVGVAQPVVAKDVLLLDAETGAIRARLAGHPTGNMTVAFSPDGRTLATAGLDRSIKLWDVATAKELATQNDGLWVTATAFSPDGRWLAYAGGDEKVRLLDLRRLRPAAAGNSGSVQHDDGEPVGSRKRPKVLPAPMDPA